MPKGIQFVQMKNLFVFSSYSSMNFPPSFYIMLYTWPFIVVQSLRRVSLRPHGLQHARFPHPSLFPGVCSDSCPLCQWCHPTISSSVTPFSSRDDSDGKESACTVGDPGSIPGWGRSPGEGPGYPLQYSCLEDFTDRGTWQATVHGVADSQTQLSD